MPACPQCGTEVGHGTLACPACGALIHAQTLKELASNADRATQAGELLAAREHWQTARGLLPASTNAGAVATNGSQDFVVNIPAGTTYARFSLFDTEVSQASDLDMEVYGPAGTLVG